MTFVGTIDVGVITMIGVIIAALVILEKFNVVSLSGLVVGLMRELRDLLALRPTAGAVNIAGVIFAGVLILLYFVVPEFERIFSAISPGSHGDGTNPILFVFAVAVLVLGTVICVNLQRK